MQNFWFAVILSLLVKRAVPAVYVVSRTQMGMDRLLDSLSKPLRNNIRGSLVMGLQQLTDLARNLVNNVALIVRMSSKYRSIMNERLESSYELEGAGIKYKPAVTETDLWHLMRECSGRGMSCNH